MLLSMKDLNAVISSVTRQKGESQNRCFKKTKQAKFSKNEHLLPSDTYTYLRVHIREVRNVRFSENLNCFVFLKHPL